MFTKLIESDLNYYKIMRETLNIQPFVVDIVFRVWLNTDVGN